MLAFALRTAVMASILVSTWFVTRRGTVQGIVMFFSGVGGIVLIRSKPAAAGLLPYGANDDAAPPVEGATAPRGTVRAAVRSPQGPRQLGGGDGQSPARVRDPGALRSG